MMPVGQELVAAFMAAVVGNLVWIGAELHLLRREARGSVRLSSAARHTGGRCR